MITTRVQEMQSGESRDKLTGKLQELIKEMKNSGVINTEDALVLGVVIGNGDGTCIIQIPKENQEAIGDKMSAAPCLMVSLLQRITHPDQFEEAVVRFAHGMVKHCDYLIAKSKAH